MRKLCPYHQEGLGWDECTEGFEGCEFEEAREEEVKNMEEEDNKVICPVCNHVITDMEECVNDPCEHVVLTYVDILNGEFVHEGDEQIAKELLEKYNYEPEDEDEEWDDKSLDELMEEYANEHDDYVTIELTTSGLSCGPCSSTEYHLIKLK